MCTKKENYDNLSRMEKAFGPVNNSDRTSTDYFQQLQAGTWDYTF